MTAYETLQQYLALRRAEGRSAGMRVVHPDVDVHLPSTLPWGGHIKGVDAFTVLGDTVRSYIAVDGANGAVTTHDAGDYALIKFTGTATAVGTGTSFPYRTAEFFTVTDGLITEIEIFYGDTAHILDAIGGSA